MFKIDGKTLQLRWTDIEIRRHVIPKMIETNRLQEESRPDDDDEDLPTFEEAPTQQEGGVSSKLIQYDSSSGSDTENRTQNTGLDLEELD